QNVSEELKNIDTDFILIAESTFKPQYIENLFPILDQTFVEDPLEYLGCQVHEEEKAEDIITTYVTSLLHDKESFKKASQNLNQMLNDTFCIANDDYVYTAVGFDVTCFLELI
ncbi:hypothetical protein, partial [Flammeovirga sp. SJP92]|uniref:hypothetical protein n=1 Tax=Flammeovirga sp. SJP92 TaxID=1775430 RepID=UPI00156028DD